MKRLRCRIRKFKKLFAYYLLGYYPIDHEVERKKNIEFIFRTVYEWKDVVTNKYDYFFHIYHDDSIAKDKTIEFYTEPNLIAV